MMLLLTCCIMGVGLVMAQSPKVTGKVLSDEDGAAIIGATVLVKGTTIGTVTAVNDRLMLMVFSI